MNYRFTIHWSIALVVSIILSGCQKEVVQKDIDTELPKLVADNNLVSLSACIIKDDKIVWNNNYGYSNKEGGVLADKETIYHIGSISKLFIVTAIMQLEEQGKLNLDEDISAYLPIVFRHPDFPDTPVTTRMLLTHTAGLSWPGSYDSQQGMWNQFEPDQGPAPSDWVPEFLIPEGIHYDAGLWKPIEPGEYEFYSNIGACVAAYVVEQVSNLNFREYCKEHIFIPLNMHSTSYNYADLDWGKIALLYDNQGYGSTYFDNRVYAGGGAKSTVQDLSYFALCYLNKGILNGTRILSEESVNKIFEIQNQASGKCLIWNAYLGDWFGHTGGLVLGTATTLLIQPESKTGLIIFTNKHSGAVHPGGEIFWLLKQKANEYID
jgi:CubicO group peptidase (beta-lactamase class C family)